MGSGCLFSLLQFFQTLITIQVC